jgi:TM2 domain-containing membrane protein YozV
MRRTDDPNVIEHRLLELAYTTDSPITATTLAYFAPSSIEDAERVLDNLVARDRIHMEVRDDGQIEYVVPNRHKLEAMKERPREPHDYGLVRQFHTPIAIRNGRTASPLLAGALSLLVPGAGQIYTGNFLSAILWFILVSAGYTLILPGLFLHLFCIAAAASSAHRLNSTLARLQLEAGH